MVTVCVVALREPCQGVAGPVGARVTAVAAVAGVGPAGGGMGDGG